MRKVAYWIGAVLFASGLFHLFVFFVDGGPWEGPVSWRKAVTFGVSFGVTLAGVAWVSKLLRVTPWTERRRTQVIGAASALYVLSIVASGVISAGS